MNDLTCLKTILFLIMSAYISISQDNFKHGDRWEYEYHKSAYFYYGPTPYDHSSDSMVGTITVYLDSVVRRFDSTQWYLHIHDSISVWQRKGAPGGYRFITVKFVIDSTYGQVVTTGKNTDNIMYWGYSKVLTPTNISSDFVAFVRQSDTTLSLCEDSCSPVCSTKVFRKTSVGVCSISNGNNYELLTQEVIRSITSSDSKYGSDDNILISWSDSVGLCQKIILNSFTNPEMEDLRNPENGSNWERFILVRYNGDTVVMKPADVKVVVPTSTYRQGITRITSAYFDLRGRRLRGEYNQLPENGVVIRLYPDGQCHLRCIIQR